MSKIHSKQIKTLLLTVYVFPKCVLELRKKNQSINIFFFNIFGASTANQGRMLIIFVWSN